MPDVTPEATPGQAAYEAFMRSCGLSPYLPGDAWASHDPGERCNWEAAAEAAIETAIPSRDELFTQLSLDMEEIASLRGRLRHAEESGREWAVKAATACDERDQAQDERDDYAARLKAVDRSWAAVAAERDAARERIAAALKLADEAKPGLTAMCTCYDCERYGDGSPGYEDYTPHPGRVMSWKLDPAAVRAALAGDAPRHVPDDGEYPDAEEIASFARALTEDSDG